MSFFKIKSSFNSFDNFEKLALKFYFKNENIFTQILGTIYHKHEVEALTNKFYEEVIEG